MPLIIPLFPGRNRLLSDGNASSYLVLHNFEEGGSSSQGENDIVPRRKSHEEEEKSNDDDLLPPPVVGPAKNEEELWSEVVAFVREESLHCFSNDELRKALMGNNTNDGATSLVVVVEDEKTSTGKHLNIDFCKINRTTTTTTTTTTFIDDDTSADDDDDDEEEEHSTTTKKLRCLSTLSQQSLRIIHKVSSQRLLSSNPFLSSVGSNLSSSTHSYCRME